MSGGLSHCRPLIIVDNPGTAGREGTSEMKLTPKQQRQAAKNLRGRAALQEHRAAKAQAGNVD
jgi:hypothetical protein